MTSIGRPAASNTGETTIWRCRIVPSGRTSRRSPATPVRSRIAVSTSSTFLARSSEAVRERTHPEDRAKNVEEVETATRERTGVAGERRLVLPDGTIRHLQTVVSPVFDAAGRPIEIIGTAMDVTERKCAEEALRESEERYRALIEVSPQMVWLARADGSNIFWSQWWYDYTGLTRAESEGFDWMQAVHPEHRDQCAEFFRQALASGAEWSNEAPVRRAADGQYRWHFG